MQFGFEAESKGRQINLELQATPGGHGDPASENLPCGVHTLWMRGSETMKARAQGHSCETLPTHKEFRMGMRAEASASQISWGGGKVDPHFKRNS